MTSSLYSGKEIVCITFNRFPLKNHYFFFISLKLGATIEETSIKANLFSFKQYQLQYQFKKKKNTSLAQR